VEKLAATLGRDAHYALQSITLGARLSRFDVQITGNGENVDVQLDGLALLGADQETDTHSAIVHAKPNCRSRQLHKVVLDDKSHAVFNGKIVVARHAQRTDSAQSARGLLLSDRARVDITPELEIEADDVKCAHGAAIGQIDADQLFYLKSRGLDEAGARDLLTYAFAAEVVDRVPLESLRKQLRAVVVGRTDRRRKEAEAQEVLA
jgi:Fe-S cluster assembly protein SufD